MSVDAAKQFINRVRKDAALQSQLQTSGENVNAMLKVAATAGFSFTADEFMAASVSGWMLSSETLSESELDSVAGGGGGTQSAAGACYTLGSGPDCTTSGDTSGGTGKGHNK